MLHKTDLSKINRTDLRKINKITPCVDIFATVVVSEKSAVKQKYRNKGNSLMSSPDSKVHGAYIGANMGPTGPRWASCCLHEPCYHGAYSDNSDFTIR